MNVIHVTSYKNRLAIERWGLKARTTSEHNFPKCGLECQPKGVYACKGGATLFKHAHYQLGHEIERDWRDLWRIDTTGLTVCNDSVLGGWYVVIPEDVPPDRLTRVKRIYDQWAEWPDKAECAQLCGEEYVRPEPTVFDPYYMQGEVANMEIRQGRDFMGTVGRLVLG